MAKVLSLDWFRRDLRIADNPALSASPVTPQPVAAPFVQQIAAPGLETAAASA